MSTDVNLQGLKILLVEDEPDLRQLFVWVFEDQGLDVKVAGTVAEARELLKQYEFNIVLSDIKMPDATGVELFNFINENKISIDRKYFMTAYNNEEFDFSSLKVDKLFKKPLKTKEIMDYLLEDFKLNNLK